MKYLDQLRHPKWQRKRLEVLNQAGWRCEECGADDRQLHVHHKCYRGGKLAWEYELRDLEALCGPCHLDRHGYLRAQGHFDLERAYPRIEISRVLGCPPKGFLPMVDGHVVAGFFRRKYNPCAPEIVLPGNLPYIKEPTEIFCRQSFTEESIDDSRWPTRARRIMRRQL